MCSTSLHVAFSSVSSIASPSHSARTPFAGSSWLRPLRPRERAVRVGSIRGFAGDGAEKEETSASPTGENGGGAALTDAAKGFGAGVRAGGGAEKKKSKTVRRSAPQQPLLQSAPKENQVSQIESAYVVALGLFLGLIFVEGVALAASGFLPEDWDEFLVKSLYPSFTPTVGLFLVAAAGYGVFKYRGIGPSKE